MAHAMSVIKRILSLPFRRKRPPGDIAPVRGAAAEEGRRNYIVEQIAALDSEISNLKLRMEIDQEGQPAASDIRRQLIHARDLRYKASLLRAEIERSFLKSDLRLDSPNHRLRIEELRGLHGRGAEHSTLECIRGLADIDPGVRRTAATILGWQRSHQAGSALATMLGDENNDVRLAAAEALGRIGSEQTVFMLIRALRDGERSMRSAARAALARILDIPMDVDIDQDEEKLIPEVEALLRWWTETFHFLTGARK